MADFDTREAAIIAREEAVSKKEAELEVREAALNLNEKSPVPEQEVNSEAKVEPRAEVTMLVEDTPIVHMFQAESVLVDPENPLSQLPNETVPLTESIPTIAAIEAGNDGLLDKNTVTTTEEQSTSNTSEPAQQINDHNTPPKETTPEVKVDEHQHEINPVVTQDSLHKEDIGKLKAADEEMAALHDQDPMEDNEAGEKRRSDLSEDYTSSDEGKIESSEPQTDNSPSTEINKLDSAAVEEPHIADEQATPKEDPTLKQGNNVKPEPEAVKEKESAPVQSEKVKGESTISSSRDEAAEDFQASEVEKVADEVSEAFRPSSEVEVEKAESEPALEPVKEDTFMPIEGSVITEAEDKVAEKKPSEPLEESVIIEPTQKEPKGSELHDSPVPETALNSTPKSDENVEQALDTKEEPSREATSGLGLPRAEVEESDPPLAQPASRSIDGNNAPTFKEHSKVRDEEETPVYGTEEQSVGLQVHPAAVTA